MKAKSSPSMDKGEKRAVNFIEIALGSKSDRTPMRDTAKRLLEEYRGKYWGDLAKRNRYRVNSIASLANLLLPNLIFQSPYIRVRPTSAKYFKELVDGAYVQIDNMRAAQVREASINHLYSKKLKGIEEHKRALFDSFWWGFGITKTGYSFETISQKDYEYINSDTPFLKRINPDDFGWHPLATNLDESELKVQRVLMTKDHLENFKHLDKDKLEDMSGEIPEYIKDRYDLRKMTDIGEDNYVVLYEVHDDEKNVIYTFGGDSHILLDKRERKYKYAGSDFSMIRLIDDPDNFSGIPIMSLIEDEALALNEVMTLTVEHYRKFPGQVFVQKGSVDEDDLIRMQNGELGSIHEVGDPEKIKFKPPMSMGPDYLNLVNLFQNMMDRILGIPDFQRATGSSRKSATEAAFIQGDVTIRRKHLVSLVKEFIIGDIKKLSDLQAQFMGDSKEVIQASGDLRGMHFEYTGRDLKLVEGDNTDAEDAKYAYDFDVDEMQALNEVQMTSLTNLISVLAANPVTQPILQLLDPMKFGKMMFKSSGFNMESMMKGSIESMLFQSPEEENKVAREGKYPMPAPKPGEDHEHHIKAHTEDLKLHGPNEQILEHLAETVMLKQGEEGLGQPQTADQPPVGAQATPPLGGPVGPNQPPMAA